MKKRIILTLAVLLPVTCFSRKAGDLNYMKEFGDSYTQGIVFFNSNRWMADTLSDRKLCPATCFSIVFPELIRYHLLIDAIQITALETLYIQYGSEYSDFSIGRFQMKPSFAEKLENDWKNFQKKPFHIEFPASNDPVLQRKLRIRKLESINGQLDYLSVFVILCYHYH